MQKQTRAILYILQFLMQRFAMAIFALLAMVLLSATLLATFGVLPWLELAIWWDGAVVPNAGIYVQVGLTVFALTLCFFLPSNQRIMALETSHRKFNLGMEDVARAYVAAHSADRTGIFQISSQFEAVRERLAYLRNHPDLSHLEPQVLEIAAEMSYVSKELAMIYSDEKVARARNFLTQRQEEVAQFNERLERAKVISHELKHWQQEVELEEAVAAAQLERLREELKEILPEIVGEEHMVVEVDNNFLELPKAAE